MSFLAINGIGDSDLGRQCGYSATAMGYCMETLTQPERVRELCIEAYHQNQEVQHATSDANFPIESGK